MGIALYAILEDGSVPEMDGKSLGRHVGLLDNRAEALGCTPLMEFFAPGDEEIDLAAELGVETPESGVWFDPEAGLRTVRAYLEVVGELLLGQQDVERIESDLRALESALDAALLSRTRWRLGIDI